jgi:hypothetical protein
MQGRLPSGAIPARHLAPQYLLTKIKPMQLASMKRNSAGTFAG